MDRIFLDTNVVLDLLLKRKEFLTDAIRLFTLIEYKKIEAVVCPVTYTTASYFLSREKYQNQDELFTWLSILLKTAVVDGEIIQKALHSKFRDFEDSVQHQCAINEGCKVIITRNRKYFQHALLPVMLPKEYLASLEK
ncbi:PIN domain-containing protein [Persicobacter diffluens]|uniref:Twitching motility protein PilT n=1 Tax=Persicobacter diffluens TaxID=981 RepID=A0AAN4VUR4_9BACT|nr:twitching motility protein PilT [Persicobacter diffluens]